MKQILTLIMVMFCVTASAQKTVVADTIDAESLINHKPITQHKWTAYEYVDTCTARYAVVHDWTGRCGLYDLVTNRNLTELEYRKLYLHQKAQDDNGTSSPMFFAYKGRTKGMVTVTDESEVIEATTLDEDLTYSLDSCKTIDKRLMRKCRDILKKNLKDTDSATHAEVLVLDTKSGHIKAWVALEKQNGRILDSDLRKNHVSYLPFKYVSSCVALADANLIQDDIVDTGYGIDSVGGLQIKDQSWMHGGFGRVRFKEAFIKHSDIAMAKAISAVMPIGFKNIWFQMNNSPRETDVMQIASFYNIIANGGIVIIPSVNSDSVHIEITEDAFPTSRQVDICRKVLKATLQEDGIGSSWTTKKVDIAGSYAVHRNCQPTLYDDNADEIDRWYREGFHNYDQVTFNGYLPSNDPRYTISVVMDKKGNPCSGRAVSYTVNKLAEYLNKH